MKRYSQAWYKLQAYGVIGRKPNTERDARIIVTKSYIQQAGWILAHEGYTELRAIPMGMIKGISGSQAREVNTFIPDYF